MLQVIPDFLSLCYLTIMPLPNFFFYIHADFPFSVIPGLSQSRGQCPSPSSLCIFCTLTCLSPVPIGVCVSSFHFQISNILTVYLPDLLSTFLLQPMAALVVGISPSQREPNKKAGMLPLPRATSAETI